MRWCCASILLLAISFCSCTENPPAAPVPKYTPAELEERLDRKTAEGTLRALVIGMQVDDVELLQELAGPLTKEDLRLLESDQRPTLSEEIQLQQGAALKIRHLQPGDKLRRADGSEQLLSPLEINATSMVLEIETIPTPLRVYKVDDRWHVDVMPLLAARRAAKKL